MLLPPPRSPLFPYTTLFRSFIEPTFRALCDGARYVDERLREIFDELRPNVIVEDNVVDDHVRSEEHTSELQSHSDLVCRLLLEKKKHQARLYKCSRMIQARR